MIEQEQFPVSFEILETKNEVPDTTISATTQETKEQLDLITLEEIMEMGKKAGFQAQRVFNRMEQYALDKNSVDSSTMSILKLLHLHRPPIKKGTKIISPKVDFEVLKKTVFKNSIPEDSYCVIIAIYPQKFNFIATPIIDFTNLAEVLQKFSAVIEEMKKTEQK